MAVDAALAGTAKRLSNPTEGKDEELLEGMKLYRSNCGGCHGDASHPSQWGKEGFYPRVPQFRESPPRKPDWQIFWIVRHGIRYSGMGAWSQEMVSDKQAWEIVPFLVALIPCRPSWTRHGIATDRLAESDFVKKDVKEKVPPRPELRGLLEIQPTIIKLPWRSLPVLW